MAKPLFAIAAIKQFLELLGSTWILDHSSFAMISGYLKLEGIFLTKFCILEEMYPMGKDIG